MCIYPIFLELPTFTSSTFTNNLLFFYRVFSEQYIESERYNATEEKNDTMDTRIEQIIAEIINSNPLLSNIIPENFKINEGNEAINDNVTNIIVINITNATYFKDIKPITFLNSKNPLNPFFAKFTDAKQK